jgi:hypothetical protein
LVPSPNKKVHEQRKSVESITPLIRILIAPIDVKSRNKINN